MPKKEKKPYLAALPTDVDYSQALWLIDRLVWRTARKTNQWGKPQTPHQYTVRNRKDVSQGKAEPDPEAEAIYTELHRLIHVHGRVETYGKKERFYMYPGDGRKYWVMNPIEISGVINRMWIADDIERLRKTGQIP